MFALAWFLIVVRLTPTNVLGHRRFPACIGGFTPLMPKTDMLTWYDNAITSF